MTQSGVLTRRPALPLLGRWQENVNVFEWFRYFVEQLIVVPAAGHLPLPVALTLANAAGALDLLIPASAQRVTLNEIGAATGLKLWRRFPLAAQRLATYRQDLVYKRRMGLGLERLDDWTVVESGSEGVQALLDQHKSFLLAGGHFSGAAAYLRHKRIQRAFITVAGALPELRLSPHELRRRLDAKVHLEARGRLLGIVPARAQVPDVWVRDLNWTAAPEKTPSVQDTMVAKLSGPDEVGYILVDAYWEKPNAYRRSFAGIADRGFAMGAPRIARLAQCPIVPYVPVLLPQPRSVRIEWGEPIEPPAPDDRDADRRILDELLDWLERAIARHPTQYLHPIGSQRHWHAESQKWS